MLKRIFFITIFSGPIALAQAPIGLIQPPLVGIPANSPGEANQNQGLMAQTQDITELQPLENAQTSTLTTTGLNQLQPTITQKPTIPLTDDVTKHLEQSSALLCRESTLNTVRRGWQAGAKFGGLGGLVPSAFFATGSKIPLAHRGFIMLFGPSSTAIAGGALGAVIGLIYAHRKLRNDQPKVH